MIDTADLIEHKGRQYVVACVHTDFLYVMGHPERRFGIDEITLVKSADETERAYLNHLLAQSSGSGHRPVCARVRVGSPSVDEDYC